MHCCLHRVTSASRQTRIQLFLERMMELSDPLLELGYIVPAMSIRNAMLLRLLLLLLMGGPKPSACAYA